MNYTVRKTRPTPIQRSRKSLELNAKPVSSTAVLTNAVNEEVVYL